MGTVNLIIDGQPVAARDTSTILDAARAAGIYIPTLCNHPDLPPAGGKKPAPVVFNGQTKIKNAKPDDLTGCGLCVVEVAGEEAPKPACVTPVADGMAASTDTPALKQIRQDKLAPILARHPHACLACAQAMGCSRSQCSSNVAEEERCCPKFGHCELQDVVNFVGIPADTPRWIPKREPVLDSEPLFQRDYTLCIGCTRCVRVCDDLRGIGALGWVWDAEGQVQVGSLAPSLAESGCRFCTACVEVCPTGAIMDKNLGSGDKASRLAPCKSACPAGIDVPEYVRLIADGKPEAALATVRETMPLPGVLGRVCVHPCEETCRRGEVNEPVSICLLKRFAADNGGEVWKQAITKAADSGRKVAIVGAGPAGLTAAFFLAKKGHAVTILEAEDQPGGMLRHGIPVFR
ncbi:FAD-dependent oxidoreductase, partial [Patescibacteria group bacterium]|nr:FAD-dependent oxidoreductase [Patescibacteria group bacterium]